MRRLFFVVAVLALASLFSACEPAASNNAANKPANAANNSANMAAKPADSAAIEAEIKKLVNDMAASMTKNDAAAFEKGADDIYMFIGPDGAIATKAQRLASLKSGDTKYESVAYDEVGVRSNPAGTGAIVIARATVKGTNMGKKVDGQFRVTQVWRKGEGGWKIVHGHATPITASATTPAANTASSNAAPPSNSGANANK